MNKFYFFLFFFTIVLIATIFAIDKYIGESYYFIFFTITSNLLLYFGFRKNAIFFDTFIGVFLWLGFWLKTTIRILFMDSKFEEGLENFNISASAFDEAILISSISFLALILASYIREKLFFKYPDENKNKKSGLFLFYKNNRKIVLIFYILLFFFIALSNFNLGIYQKGEITQTVLPFGLNGIYKWLLLFGLSSFAALILKYEFDLQKKPTFFVPILTLVEAFVTNVSFLSRAMIINSSALGYGLIKNHKIKTIRYYIILVVIFGILFLSSIVLVNELRKNVYKSENNTISKSITNVGVDKATYKIIRIFLNRWVGIEGMIAVSSYEKKGWPLFRDAINEKYDEHKTSFYDLNFINSPYLNTDMTKHHYTSIPGYIAFFYYSGSVLFLFFMLFIFSLLASFIEILAYKLGGNNLIFSALIAQVIAYRYIHFGYVPAQSYLLFGSIFFNIFIIYILNKLLLLRYK